MGIDNSLFGKIQSPIVSPALAAGVDKANENKAREDSMKEIMSRKPTASTDQAQLAATVAPQKKAPQKSESSKPTASPSQPKTRSWQDKMGSTAAEMGKAFYGVDAKDYNSKADYDKAVDDAIAKRDAGLKGDNTAQTKPDAETDGKMTVAEGPNAGKQADMTQTTGAAPQPTTSAAPALPQAAVPAATPPMTTAGLPASAPIISQQMENGRLVTTVNQPNGIYAADQTAAPQTAEQQQANAQRNTLPQGVLQEGVNAEGQPYVVVTPEYARLHGLGAQQPNGVGPQDPGNYPGRYVGGATPSEAGSESFLSKWGLPIGAALLGGVLGYQFGKNSNDNNDSRYYDNSYDRGYGFNDY